MNKLREEENDDLIDGQEAIIDRATPRVDRILAEHHEGLPVPTPPRKRKQRSDKGKQGSQGGSAHGRPQQAQALGAGRKALRPEREAGWFAACH